MDSLLCLTFLTWRESVAGVLPSEGVVMELRRTWDVAPVRSGTSTVGGDTLSEAVGTIRWTLEPANLFGQACQKLKTVAYDKRTSTGVLEEFWVKSDGTILRQRTERTTDAGKQTGDAAYGTETINLTQTDLKGKVEYVELHPAEGMARVQARFKPLTETRKSFAALDPINGTLKTITVEKAGRFRGTWGGERYDGDSYRFTVDKSEITVMLTKASEVVQVQFTPTISLVLLSPTASRRKGG